MNISSSSESLTDCSICLQKCIYPIKLECGHIFCFLCAKGVLIISKRCALCRREISPAALNNAELLDIRDLQSTLTDDNDSISWFYEGKDGWWLYDQRTSTEIERAYQQSSETLEILVAGNIYVIDLKRMVQVRRTEPFRKRKIKRDLLAQPKKGVAGIQIPSTESQILSQQNGPPVTQPHFQSLIPRPGSIRELGALARDLDARLTLNSDPNPEEGRHNGIA